MLIGISAILSALMVPITAGLLGLGIFAAAHANQQQDQPPYQQYQPDLPDQPPQAYQQSYQPYQQGYQPPQPAPGVFEEGGMQYEYPPQPQPKQEYDQPQEMPPQEMPPQQ
ncbi:MAG: hypothetical protein NVS3B14_17830 [Ktedonobacteraceae bacterium]